MDVVEEVVIVGAGIAGLATAVALKRLGIYALVLERSDTLRATGAALTLFPNAWRALHALGVSESLTSTYSAPARRSFITNLETGAVKEIAFSRPNGEDEFRSRTVHRKALLETLARALPPGSIHFSSKLAAVETLPLQDSSIAVVHLADGTVIKAKALIGCDGVHSVVARWLGMAAPVHSGRSEIRGLAVYPDGHDLEDVHQFVGTGKRAGIVPITNTEIYWFFTSSLSNKDHSGGDPKMIQREVLEKYGKDLPELYRDIVKHSDMQTLTWVPLMARHPWKVAFGTLNRQCVTVAGDAMHPMTPDLGQGGASALEDAVILGRHLAGASNVSRALADYAEERRWRATWLIAGSYLSGWIQQGGSSWGVKMFRDLIFYRFLFRRIASVIEFDCGKLPVAQPETTVEL